MIDGVDQRVPNRPLVCPLGRYTGPLGTDTAAFLLDLSLQSMKDREHPYTIACFRDLGTFEHSQYASTGPPRTSTAYQA